MQNILSEYEDLAIPKDAPYEQKESYLKAIIINHFEYLMSLYDIIGPKAEIGACIKTVCDDSIIFTLNAPDEAINIIKINFDNNAKMLNIYGKRFSLSIIGQSSSTCLDVQCTQIL